VAVPLRRWALGELDGQVRRSVYRTWAPAGPLAPVVACLWAGDPGWARGIRLLPDGCVDLVWNGAALTLFAAGAQPRHVTLPAARRQVGVRLRCGAAGALLGVDLAALGVAQVPLGELVGAPARRVEHELAGRSAASAQLAALAGLLTDLLRAGPGPDPAVLATAALLAGPGARVDEVGERLGVSPRALRRRVRAAVGLTPKELHRVLRFHRFTLGLGEIAAGHRSLARAAAELGYADQAHLGRECLRLSGSTPATLVGSWAQPGRVAAQ
jgi:AraC-like DNA-binding protein